MCFAAQEACQRGNPCQRTKVTTVKRRPGRRIIAAGLHGASLNVDYPPGAGDEGKLRQSATLSGDESTIVRQSYIRIYVIQMA
jgi:hypothetical protein